MSADNGIYILKTRDGYRVAHLQAIDNIYWHPNCCENPSINESIDGFDSQGDPLDNCYHEKCENCGSVDPEWLPQEQAYLPTVYNYFKDAAVWETEDAALVMANAIYRDIIADPICPIVEYGIQYINGLEDLDFNTMALDPKESND